MSPALEPTEKREFWGKVAGLGIALVVSAGAWAGIIALVRLLV